MSFAPTPLATASPSRGPPDGEAAERRAAGEPHVDLVVLDLMIPGIDGWELCRRWQVAGGPPMIMLTARGAESERILVEGEGAGEGSGSARPTRDRKLRTLARPSERLGSPSSATPWLPARAQLMRVS